MAEVNIYINECSFRQGPSSDSFKEDLCILLECCNIIKGIPNYSSIVFYNPEIFLKIILSQGTNFSKWLKTNKELSQSFKQTLGTSIKKSSLCKDGTVYKYKTEDVTHTSIAEAYESTHGNYLTFLINLLNSPYGSPEIKVTKSGVGEEFINSFFDPEGLTIKLQDKGLLPRYYDTNSDLRPQDSQTILSDKTRFRPTKNGNRNNRLYERISNPDELWCLDRGHVGGSIHLEVFNKKTKKQIHVSRHDEICFFRELTKKEKTRNLEIEVMP